MPEAPHNGGYLILAYTVAGIIYLGYTAVLWARAKKALRSGD